MGDFGLAPTGHAGSSLGQDDPRIDCTRLGCPPSSHNKTLGELLHPSRHVVLRLQEVPALPQHQSELPGDTALGTDEAQEGLLR